MQGWECKKGKEMSPEGFMVFGMSEADAKLYFGCAICEVELAGRCRGPRKVAV